MNCPHCGSDKGTWFSRTLPMANVCESCGKDVDEKTTTSGTTTPNPKLDKLCETYCDCATAAYELKQAILEYTTHLQAEVDKWRDLVNESQKAYGAGRFMQPLCELPNDIKALSAENAALKADKERLDWLESDDVFIDGNHILYWGDEDGRTLKTAIDKARKETK